MKKDQNGMDEKNPWKKDEQRIAKESLDVLFQKTIFDPFDFETSFHCRILNCLLEKANINLDSKFIFADVKKNRGNDSVKDFYEIAKEKISKNKSQHCKWRFFIPLKCKLAKDVQQPVDLKIHETNFHFSNWQEAENEIGKEKLHNLLNNSHISLPSTCLIVESFGDSLKNAFNKIAPAYDVFRAMIEMPYTIAKNTIFQIHSFRKSSEKPRRWLPCPEWFLGLSEENQISPGEFLVDKYSDDKEVEISSSDIQVIKELSLDFEKKPDSKSILFLVSDCLRLYVQAVDEKFDYNAFLAFWQLLETIALSGEIGGCTDEVCKRTNKILKTQTRSWLNKPDCTLYLLKNLAQKRNALVHEGKREGIDYLDVTFSKIFCQYGIFFLLAYSDTFPAIQQLKDFYQFSDERPKILESKRQVINYVLDKNKK
jgi:hypothetical protein